MVERGPKRKSPDFNDPVLLSLIEDPTRSPQDMADEVGITRQMFWRVKKRLEDEVH